MNFYKKLNNINSINIKYKKLFYYIIYYYLKI